MTTPTEDQPLLKRHRPSRFPTVTVLLLLVGLGALLFKPALGLLMAIALRGTSNSVAPAAISQAVADGLMRWGILGAPDRIPEHKQLRQSIASRITGINGFTESDGFHGDGTDWYEVDLSPDLASELRIALAQSTTVKQSTDFPRGIAAPSWWPTKWPADARCYQRGGQFFVLSDSGTRAWMLRIRT